MHLFLRISLGRMPIINDLSVSKGPLEGITNGLHLGRESGLKQDSDMGKLNEVW